MRKLTKYFGTYTLAKHEKATGKGVLDLLNIGNFEISKIATLIKLGNRDIKDEEEAYDKLDEYLKSDDENSLITAYFDLIDELDHDIKLLKSCGIKVEDLKAEFSKMANGMGDQLKEKLSNAKVKNDTEDKVDINDKKIIELSTVKDIQS